MSNVVYIARPNFTIMEYNRIIAITGLSGLYELLSSKSDGAIVRSLEDQQTRFVSSRVHNFSHLESIEVYTTRENINLVALFQAIQTSGAALPSEKDAAAVKAFFVKVYPELDFDRIYNSDMKKMVRWYALLSENKVEFKLPEPEEEGGDTVEEPAAVEAPAKATPKEKSEAHAKEPAKAKAAPVKEKAEAPAKKAKEEPVAKHEVLSPRKVAKAAPAAEEAPKKKAAPAKPAAKAEPKTDPKKKAAPKKK
jgi:hypothetical protein